MCYKQKEVLIILYSLQIFFRKILSREHKLSCLPAVEARVIDELILPSSGKHKTCTFGIFLVKKDSILLDLGIDVFHFIICFYSVELKFII